MKKLLLLTIFSLWGIWSYGQHHLIGQKDLLDTIQFDKNRHFIFSTHNQDTEIFSFRMTGDTSLLKPIDTAYYKAKDQLQHMVIFYRYNIFGVAKYLAVENYFDGQVWLFYGMQSAIYKKNEQ